MDWDEQESKRRISVLEKSSIKATDGSALIMHGGSLSEHRELTEIGFSPEKIISVERERNKHETFIAKAPRAYTRRSALGDVYTVMDNLPSVEPLQYVHIDLNGSVNNHRTHRRIFDGVRNIVRLASKTQYVRVRFSASKNYRNASKYYSSKEQEWSDQILSTFEDLLDREIALEANPASFFTLIVMACATFNVNKLDTEVFCFEEYSSSRFSRNVENINIISYSDGYPMYTTWMDLAPLSLNEYKTLDNLKRLSNRALDECFNGYM